MSLLKVSEFTEEEARAYIEKIRWPNGPVCPHCEHDKAYEMNGKAHAKPVKRVNAVELKGAIREHES